MDQEDTKRLEIYLGTIAKWKTRVKDEILSVLPVSENDKITNMNTEQRMKYLMNHLHNNNDDQQLVIPKIDLLNIDFKKSITNDLFKIECEVEDSEAVKLLKKFTIKILFAKTNSQELSLLLNDRSDLLFRLSMFQSCVDDISRINLDFFPSSVQQEIFRRQAKSHIALTIQSLSTLVDNPMMFNEEDDNLIQDLVYNFESISGISFNAGNECLFEPTIPIFPEKNEFIPGFSDAVKLNYSDELGRFLTATRDLLPGELIGACKTYVSVVSRDDRHNFCWFCKKQTYNGIACEACPLVLYCSVDCLNESHEQYHSIECAILPLLLIDDDYIVLTMALRTTIKAYKECECDIDKLMSTYDVNAKSPTKVELLKSDHDPNKYGSVDKGKYDYNFRANNNYSTFFANSLLITYYMALKIKIIKGNELLCDLTNNKEFMYLLAFMHNNMRIINLYKTDTCSDMTKLHCATLTPGSLNFHNQCYSQISSIQVKDHDLFFTTEQIKKGDKIGYSRMLDWQDYGLMPRRLYAKINYSNNYMCVCEACINDWKLEENSVGNDICETLAICDKIDSLNRKVESAYNGAIKYFCLNNELIPSTRLINDASKLVRRCQRNFRPNSDLKLEAQNILRKALSLLEVPSRTIFVKTIYERNS